MKLNVCGQTQAEAVKPQRWISEELNLHKLQVSVKAVDKTSKIAKIADILELQFKSNHHPKKS